MIIVLKKGAGKKEIDALEQKLSKNGQSGFDAQKYNGTLKIKGDALKIQKSCVMNGKEILVDTNIIIYLLQGDDTLSGILQGRQLYVSFITELELLGFHSSSKDQETQIESLLNDCLIVPLSNNIKLHYKAIRKTSKLKLADSLIAATALSLNIPLVTADKQFKTIKTLGLIQYEK